MAKDLYTMIYDKLKWIDEVVVFAWVILTTLMGISAYMLYSQAGAFTNEVKLVLILIVVTLLYPLYTFGYQQIPGLVANILYLAFSVYVISQVFTKNRIAGWLITPVLVWVSLASIYVITQILSGK